MSRSGRWLDGDFEAERLELADVIACLPAGVDAAGGGVGAPGPGGEGGGEVVGAQVPVGAGGVVEQVPDDEEEGAGDRDHGFELPHAFAQPPVAFAEEGLSLGGRAGDLTEYPFEVGVALAGLSVP